MPIQDHVANLWNGAMQFAGMKRNRAETQEVSVQDEAASPCKKLKASSEDRSARAKVLFDRPEVLKEIFSMLDPPSQVRLNACSKAIRNLRLGDDTSLVEADPLRDLAHNRIIEPLGFPLWQNIHPDPVKAAEIIYRELKFDHYINRHLDSTDHVTFEQKLAYMMHGRPIPAFATDNLHETNKQLDELRTAAHLYAAANVRPVANQAANLQEANQQLAAANVQLGRLAAAGRLTPIPKGVRPFLDAVEHHLAAGQRNRAWLQANLAFANCEPASTMRIIDRDTAHSIEAKTLVLSCYLKSSDDRRRLAAAVELSRVIDREVRAERDWPAQGALLTQVEGLLDRLTELLSDTNIGSQNHSLNSIRYLADSGEASAVRLAQHPRMIDRLIHLLASTHSANVPKALRHIITHLPDNSLLMNRAGLIEAFVQVLSRQEQDLSFAVAASVCKIASRPGGRELLENHFVQLVDLMVPILRDPSARDQRCGLTAIISLVCCMPDKIRLNQHPGLLEAVKVCISHEDENVRKEAAKLLGLIAFIGTANDEQCVNSNNNRLLMANHDGVVGAVKRLLGDHNDPETRGLGASVIGGLAHAPDNRALLLASRGLVDKLKGVLTGADATGQMHAAHAFYFLAQSPDIATRLVKRSGVVEAYEGLLASENANVKVRALETLSALASSPEGSRRIANRRVLVERLTAIVESQDAQLQVAASSVIEKL